MTLRTISTSDLEGHTTDVVAQVREGQPAVLQSAGQEQVVLLDPLDFRLLQGVASWVSRFSPANGQTPPESRVMHAYLSEEVSLGKAAEMLGISRFDLQARFVRLEIPLRQGPVDEADARDEIAVAEELAATAS